MLCRLTLSLEPSSGWGFIALDFQNYDSTNKWFEEAENILRVKTASVTNSPLKQSHVLGLAVVDGNLVNILTRNMRNNCGIPELIVSYICSMRKASEISEHSIFELN